VRRDDGGPAGEPSWHDREPVALAAGVAAFVLLALLALAVIRMSNDATEPAPYLGPVGSDGTTTTTSPTIKPLTSSSYAVPSVQTSQDTGAPLTTSAVAPPDGPGSDVPDAPPPPATIFNPYSTTTQGNAGHV
jgi:hypothetical protein